MSEALTDQIEDPSRLPGELKHIPIDQIRPNTWNPQEMSDDEFNMLAESMQGGMIDPIQVVPLRDDPNGKQFVILGGEHRWKVAETLGWGEIPAIVLTDEKFQDEDLQRFVTLRMNVIHGKLNPEKFRDIYEEMVERYDHEALQDLMGFTDSDAFDKLVGGVKEGLKAAGLPPEIAEQFNEVVEEMKTVDDIANLLNHLFTKYGDTLKNNFMVLTYGGKEHLYVKCDKTLWKKVRQLSRDVLESEISMADVMNDLLDKREEIDLNKYDKVTEPDHFEAKV